MTLQDVKRRLQVMRDRGYNANTIQDVEWLIDRVHTLEASIKAEQLSRIEWRQLFKARYVVARQERDQAILAAVSHVNRQQFAGKHEQDRADSVEWLRRWSPLVDRIRKGDE
jgi:hypothetical protein